MVSTFDVWAILIKLGRRKIVGGQDNIIVDATLDMLKSR